MRFLCLLFFVLVFNCEETDNEPKSELSSIFAEAEFIEGKPEYLNSPFVTAGQRVYMVGHQDGSFPELGWHIKNEMGGIWNHPIKLMDGFEVELAEGERTFKIEKAKSFTNFPFGNKHTYLLDNKSLKVERFQYVPDNEQGIIVHFLIENTSSKTRDFTLKFTGHTDLRPTWLGERTKMIDGLDESRYSSMDKSIIAKDKKNDWYLKFGSNRKASKYSKESSEYGGMGISRSLQYQLKVEANTSETITFIIAGSYNSEADLMDTYNRIKSGISSNLKEKKQRYLELAERTKLTIPDKKIEEAFRWLKYNSDWLVQSVPEIGTGITAGIPDYPWWFGVDSEYALKGYMRIGQTDAVYSTIRLLDSVSEAVNGNGRIIHEMSTNGAVFNKGNINETPQFASLIWDTYKWNGDKEFLKRYYPVIQKGLNWLMQEMDSDKNLFPDGPGMMEIHGLESEMIDVAAYTQKAFADASKMATELGHDSESKEYLLLARKLKRKINNEFWSSDFESYADFIGTDEETLKLIDDAIIRADTLGKPWAVEELTLTRENLISQPSIEARPFVLHHNWVVNTPMEMQIADSTKARLALRTAEKFVNPFGVFVTGIDRDESAGTDEGSFKGSKQFSYTGAVMTLPTAVQIISENNYGNPNKALDYLKKLNRSFSFALPGSMYEVSPDYGMITQAWNIYGYAVPIVSQFFGVDPMASDKILTIDPQMPLEWNDASLENIAIGDNTISIFYVKEDGMLKFKVTQLNPEWNLKIRLPRGKNVETFDEVNQVIKGDKIEFTSRLRTTEIVIYY